VRRQALLMCRIAGLKAKYGLEESQQQPVAAVPGPEYPPALEDLLLNSPELASHKDWRGSCDACPTPESILASPGAASTAAALGEQGALAPQGCDVMGNSPPSSGLSEENPTSSLGAVSPHCLPPLTEKPQHCTNASPGRLPLADTDEDAVFKQLLQLEALEEQLARQRLQESAQLGQSLLGDDPSPSPLDSLPGLATASTSSTCPGSPVSCGYGYQAGACPAGASDHCGSGQAACAGWGTQLAWDGLSQQLVQLGFPALCPNGSAGSQPDPSTVFATLSSMLVESDRSAANYAGASTKSPVIFGRAVRA
jgi:hypothetical protein